MVHNQLLKMIKVTSKYLRTYIRQNIDKIDNINIDNINIDYINVDKISSSLIVIDIVLDVFVNVIVIEIANQRILID